MKPLFCSIGVLRSFYRSFSFIYHTERDVKSMYIFIFFCIDRNFKEKSYLYLVIISPSLAIIVLHAFYGPHCMKKKHIGVCFLLSACLKKRIRTRKKNLA